METVYIDGILLQVQWNSSNDAQQQCLVGIAMTANTSIPNVGDQPAIESTIVHERNVVVTIATIAVVAIVVDTTAIVIVYI